MTAPGRMVSNQSASSCIAWLRVLVLAGCRVRRRRRAVLQHTSTEHTCRGVQATKVATLVTSHLPDLRSCTPRVHLLRVATASSHFHAGNIEQCSREKIHIPWPRTLSQVPATSTQSLHHNHTCDRSPRRQFPVSTCIKPTVINVSEHLSPRTSVNQKRNCNSNPCFHRRNFRASKAPFVAQHSISLESHW